MDGLTLATSFRVLFWLTCTYSSVGNQNVMYLFSCPPRFVPLVLLTYVVVQTLDIVAENPEKFKIVALAAGSNVTLLAEQVLWVQLFLGLFHEPSWVSNLLLLWTIILQLVLQV